MAAELFSTFYQFADVFAFLILSAAGLAIVFGMMGVINMAHGEFIMCGAYVTVGLVKLGVPLAIAQALAAVTAGLIGVAVEYLVVRRFYKRPQDSLLATWGLSLIVTQSMLLIVGSSITGIGTPEGSFAIGGYTFSTYRLVLFACAVAVLIGLYVTFMKTRFGVMARATMQNAAMARALGARTGRIYCDQFWDRRRSRGALRGALRADDDVDPDNGGHVRGGELRHRRRRRRKCSARDCAGGRVPGDDSNGVERELWADHRPDRHAVCSHPDHSRPA
jgi:branched-chain amino acid transport system permease protein